MKKLIIAVLCIGSLSMAQTIKYQVQMDAQGNLIGKETILTKNGIAKKTELNAVSNRVTAVENKFQFSGVSTNGTVTITGVDGGNIVDTGIPLENFQWQAGINNVSQFAAFVAAGNQPYGYAELDANGHISVDNIPQIYVLFNGGHRQ